MVRSAMALAASIVLAGCAAEGTSVSPVYRTGYTAGCRAGHADGIGKNQAVRYDARAFAADRAYREGFNRGYLECLTSARQRSLAPLFGFPFSYQN